MQQYKVNINLISDALIGSGEGYGALIDSDVIFDDIGIPYIPARRVKGLLRDSAIESFIIIEQAFPGFIKCDDIDLLFGKIGDTKSASIRVGNFFIDGYDINYEWLKYYSKKFQNFISKESIINSFTSLRRQTTIEDGVAKKNSLRTIRVLNKDITFSGEIEIEEDKDEFIKILAISCLNFRQLGTKRKRGLGEIKCALYIDNKPYDFIKNLEELCTN